VGQGAVDALENRGENGGEGRRGGHGWTFRFFGRDPIPTCHARKAPRACASEAQKNAAVAEGGATAALHKPCGSPERGMRLPHCPVEAGDGPVAGLGKNCRCTAFGSPKVAIQGRQDYTFVTWP